VLKFTIHQFNAMFPDEEACLDFLRDSLYPDGVTCRTCQKVTKHHRLTNRRAYSCQECGTHIYPLAGTSSRSRAPR
jgi:transposase